MPYNEELAQRLRVALAGTKNMVEKKMFGGVAFMIDDKMCVGVHNDELIVRCEAAATDTYLSKPGARVFDITGKAMKGWLLVSPEGTSSKKDFDWWLKQAIENNAKIPLTKKKSKK